MLCNLLGHDQTYWNYILVTLTICCANFNVLEEHHHTSVSHPAHTKAYIFNKD